MSATHHLTAESDNGNEIVFSCHENGCGRRLVLKRSGGLVVLDQGNFHASHVGGSDGMGISLALPA